MLLFEITVKENGVTESILEVRDLKLNPTESMEYDVNLLCDASGMYHISLDYNETEDGGMKPFVDVTVKVGGEQVYEGKLEELSARFGALGADVVEQACGAGIPTLEDVVKELLKPGRDPRDDLPAPILRTDVLEMKDLKPGMVLSGTVRNVIDFGVFVEIGVHQDGLVHISQVCTRKVRHPSEVVKVGDVVKVSVLDVDEKRKRISLTMKNIPKEL